MIPLLSETSEEVSGEGWEGKGASIYNQDEGPKVNVWGIGKQALSRFDIRCYRFLIILIGQ